MSRRRLIRSFAVANLEDPPVTIPTSTKVKKRKRTTGNTTSEGDDTPEALQSPPKSKRDRTAARREPVSSDVGTGNPKPVTVRGKILPPRSPQPGRTKRNTHPGMIDASRPRKTSAEVAAAAKRQANLQRQADEFERKRVETLAEMELQEELDDEAKERSIIRNRADAIRLDDAEDVEMRSEDGENNGPSVAEADSELSSQDDKAAAEGNVQAPKRKQVWLFRVHTITNTMADTVQQRRKKAARGETRATVDRVKATLRAAGKKGVVEHQDQTMRYA
jgi:hypothetical protein